MSSELQEKIQWFKEEYLDTPAWQRHLAVAESEPKEIKKVFEEIREKHLAGEDITDDVLRRLLPHSDTEFHRKNNYRISTWPCIIRDVLSLLSNPVLAVLTPKEGGYVLTISPNNARKRLATLASLLSSKE
jgi:hypothetical protein